MLQPNNLLPSFSLHAERSTHQPAWRTRKQTRLLTVAYRQNSHKVASHYSSKVLTASKRRNQKGTHTRRRKRVIRDTGRHDELELLKRCQMIAIHRVSNGACEVTSQRSAYTPCPSVSRQATAWFNHHQSKRMWHCVQLEQLYHATKTLTTPQVTAVTLFLPHDGQKEWLFSSEPCRASMNAALLNNLTSQARSPLEYTEPNGCAQCTSATDCFVTQWHDVHHDARLSVHYTSQ